MKAHTLNSLTLGIFAAGSMYLALWTGACGGGSDQRIREHQDAGIKQAADQADLARPIDQDRVIGSTAVMSGCLQKQSGDYVLMRTDLPPTQPTAATTGTSGSNVVDPPNLTAASAPAYRLNAKKETLDPYVGKQVKIDGKLAKLAGGEVKSAKDYAEIDVSSATLVADQCRP